MRVNHEIVIEHDDERIILVLSNIIDKFFLSLIHDRPQLEAVYVQCSNMPENVKWIQNYGQKSKTFSTICHHFVLHLKESYDWLNKI